MPTGAKNGKSHLVAVRLPLDLEAVLMATAAKKGVPYSWLIIEALREFLAKEDVEA